MIFSSRNYAWFMSFFSKYFNDLDVHDHNSWDSPLGDAVSVPKMGVLGILPPPRSLPSFNAGGSQALVQRKVGWAASGLPLEQIIKQHSHMFILVSSIGKNVDGKNIHLNDQKSYMFGATRFFGKSASLLAEKCQKSYMFDIVRHQISQKCYRITHLQWVSSCSVSSFAALKIVGRWFQKASDLEVPCHFLVVPTKFGGFS